MLSALILNIVNSILFVKFYKLFTKILNLFDKPNYRKIHKKPVSQLGGFIFFTNFLIIFLLNFVDVYNFDVNYSQRLIFILFFCYSLIFLLGYLDDKFDINSYTKTIILIILISLVVFSDQKAQITKLVFSFDQKIYLGSLSLIFTIFCIFIFINAFNMFDGINCQASLFTFLIILFLFYNGANLNLLLPIIVSNFFFLFYNFKNKIYLGNNGSYSISFILGCVIITEYNNPNNIIYADHVALMLFLPIIDLLRLFLLRLFKGKNPFKADNEHIHHLILKKCSNLNTIFIIAMFNFLPTVINFYLYKTIYILFILFFIYLAFIYYFDGFRLKLSS